MFAETPESTSIALQGTGVRSGSGHGCRHNVGWYRPKRARSGGSIPAMPVVFVPGCTSRVISAVLDIRFAKNATIYGLYGMCQPVETASCRYERCLLVISLLFILLRVSAFFFTSIFVLCSLRLQCSYDANACDAAGDYCRLQDQRRRPTLPVV